MLAESWLLQFSLSHCILLDFFSLQEFKGSLKEDVVDYSLYTASTKRKRPTPRKGRKSGYMGGEDDEDDNDDDDWTGGVRRLSNSGRKGYSTRGSRQR